MYKKLLVLIALFSFSFSQHVHDDHRDWIRCATDELEQELQLLHPEFIAERDAEILKGKRLLQQNPQWRTDLSSQNTIYIPVIFHVLYANAGDNVSAAQIGANFDQINLDPGGVVVTSVGEIADFVSRYFTPQSTILEDPATGSSHCSLIPFWSKRLNKKELLSFQISKRGGEFECIDNANRVTIIGKAKTRFKVSFSI